VKHSSRRIRAHLDVHFWLYYSWFFDLFPETTIKAVIDQIFLLLHTGVVAEATWVTSPNTQTPCLFWLVYSKKTVATLTI